MKKLPMYECIEIADKVNATLSGCGEVTSAQVQDIASGKEVLESHPVWQRIKAEIDRVVKLRTKK